MLDNLFIDEERLKEKEMWFYRLMLRITWTEHARNKENLKEMGNRKKLILEIKKDNLKYQRKFLMNQKLNTAKEVAETIRYNNEDNSWNTSGYIVRSPRDGIMVSELVSLTITNE